MERRQFVRDIEGSPIYSIMNDATIAAGESWLVNLRDTSPYSKWAPFNSFTITNNSDERIRFYMNQSSDHHFVVPDGVIKSVEKAGLNSFIIKNLSALSDIKANELEITFFTSGMTADEYAKHQFSGNPRKYTPYRWMR
jgi:hypothetical protein